MMVEYSWSSVVSMIRVSQSPDAHKHLDNCVFTCFQCESLTYIVVKILETSRKSTYQGKGGFLTKSHNTYIFCNNLKTTLKFRHYNRILTKY